MSFIGTVNDRAGTHAREIAQRDTRGTGLYSTGMNMRWCYRCAASRPTKGGKLRPGGLFVCALHLQPVKAETP